MPNYLQTVKAPFPCHLLRLPISTIPCSSSSFKYLKLSKNGARGLGRFWPTRTKSVHAVEKLFNALRCASFLCSPLPALWDWELLNLSPPQPWEVKRKKPAFTMKWLLTVNAELRKQNHFPTELEVSNRLHLLTRRHHYTKKSPTFSFSVLSTFRFCTSRHNVKK